VKIQGCPIPKEKVVISPHYPFLSITLNDSSVLSYTAAANTLYSHLVVGEMNGCPN
jgi:hypothetical protein